jgi:hypothetical protein
VVFVRQHDIWKVRRGDDVDARRDFVLFVDLGSSDAGFFEAVVKTDREEMRLLGVGSPIGEYLAGQ